MTHEHDERAHDCMMCGPEGLTAQEAEDRIKADIARDGWSDMGISAHPDDEWTPPHNYTVGLSEYGHPDLVLIGLPNGLAHECLRPAVGHIMEGKAYLPHSYSKDVLKDMDVAFLPVDNMLNEEFPMTATVRIYGERCTGMQLVWPDRNNRFPWHWDYDDTYREYQPLLGTWKGD
jgi:Domain of unknown function (DUF4262)